jgi:uncharacterized protein (DUF486 family)
MLVTLQFVGLLIVSNLFMTMAWYGHLKHKDWPILLAIAVSWGLAFFEYLFQVPANRMADASGKFNLTQLKVTQECVTLVVFLIYAAVVFREPIRWNTVVSMLFILGAVFFAFMGKK